MNSSFFWAKAPHRTNTTFSFLSEIALMIKFVNFSQPRSLWEFGECALTVSVAFNNKTPCCAQSSSSFFVLSIPKSSLSSVKIFLSEGGAVTVSETEKQRPFA